MCLLVLKKLTPLLLSAESTFLQHFFNILQQTIFLELVIIEIPNSQCNRWWFSIWKYFFFIFDLNNCATTQPFLQSIYSVSGTLHWDISNTMMLFMTMLSDLKVLLNHSYSWWCGKKWMKTKSSVLAKDKAMDSKPLIKLFHFWKTLASDCKQCVRSVDAQ